MKGHDMKKRQNLETKICLQNQRLFIDQKSLETTTPPSNVTDAQLFVCNRLREVFGKIPFVISGSFALSKYVNKTWENQDIDVFVSGIAF
jgi:hypothetical protein